MEDKVEKLALHGGVPVREKPLPPARAYRN